MKLYKSKVNYKFYDADKYYNPIVLWFPMPLAQHYFRFNSISYKLGQEESFDMSLEYWCKDHSPYNLLCKDVKTQMKIYMIKDARSPDVLLCQYFPIPNEYVLFMNDDDLSKNRQNIRKGNKQIY